MSAIRFLLALVFAVTVVWPATEAVADKPPLGKRVGGILVGDQSLDAIYYTNDRNGDGDAGDPNETHLYYSGTNSTNVCTIFQSANGYVLFGDIEADGVFWLRDLNYDCDALDPNESGPWFTSNNAQGLTVTAPGGLWEAADGTVYVLNAGTTTIPGDAIYETRDLNGDGDAEDAGESKLWFDIENLITESAPFELVMLDRTAFFTDSSGADKVMRAYDANNDGDIDADEFNIFIDETNPYGVTMFTALATDYVSLYVIDVSGDNQILWRLTDLDSSGAIDDASEAVAVWDETCVPPDYELSGTFSLAVGPSGEMVVTSNGSDTGNRDNVFRLVDRNGDGDFYDADETLVWAEGNGDGVFVERARAVEYILATPGDVDGDGEVDLADLAALLASYNRCAGDPDYNPAADFNNDNCVDLSDLATLLSRYGQSCP